MKKFLMLVTIPFMACASVPAKPETKTVTVQKIVIVEVAPLKLNDCDEWAKTATTEQLKAAMRKSCEEINEKKRLSHEATVAKAEAKVAKEELAAEKAKAEEKPRRRSGGGGGPIMTAAHPGGSVDDYNQSAPFMRRLEATKCAAMPSERSLTIRNIAEGDITGRANRVAVYLPSVGKFVDVKGCFFAPEATILADMDGNGRFDAPYHAGNLIGDLRIPADEAILYYMDCDARSVCTLATERRINRHGGRPWVSARDGNVLKYFKNRS
jgi:hypothetical protein